LNAMVDLENSNSISKENNQNPFKELICWKEDMKKFQIQS